MANELNTLFPDQEVALSNGDKFTLKPLKFGQLPKAMSFAQKITGSLAANAETSPENMVIAMMASSGEDFMDLMSFAIPCERSYFDNLNPDDGIKLAAAVVEVNMSFFVQKVSPLLEEAKERLGKINKSGQGPSSA